jgi:chemotaxis signal transduction protein
MNRAKRPEAVGQLAREDGTLDGGAILRLLDRPLLPEDLREATERVARPLASVEGHVVSLLLFRAGGERLALPATSVQHVTQLVPVHQIPHRSNHIIRGLCNVNGQLLICASLENLLELSSTVPGQTTDQPDQAQAAQRMIVLGDASECWVVQVDAVVGIMYVDPAGYQPPPLTVACALRRYVNHLVAVDQMLASLLDVPSLVSGFQAALS